MLKLPRKIKSLSRIRTGVKALIVNEGKILVVQERLAKDHPDDEQIIHDFPGGGLDLGESLITGLKREVKEEIGLEIEVGQVVGAWDFVVSHLDNPTKGVQIVCIGYQCQVKGKKLSVFKYKAKSRYRKKIGFRPIYSRYLVEKISS